MTFKHLIISEINSTGGMEEILELLETINSKMYKLNGMEKIKLPLRTNGKNAGCKSDVKKYDITTRRENRFPGTRNGEEKYNNIRYEWRGQRDRRSTYRENHTDNRDRGTKVDEHIILGVKRIGKNKIIKQDSTYKNLKNTKSKVWIEGIFPKKNNGAKKKNILLFL